MIDRLYGPFARIHFPYCFMPIDVEGLRHCYLPVSRNYKPIGSADSEFAIYEEYPEHFVYFWRDIAPLTALWRGNPLWLYNDGPASREDYFERLARIEQMMREPSRRELERARQNAEASKLSRAQERAAARSKLSA
ncbi:MAG: hypothetical protein AB1508_12705 [Pseudomonadota bacterium]